MSEKAFPDEEGRRAWCLDLAVTLTTSGRGLLGRDEKDGDDGDVGRVLAAARSFHAFLTQDKAT